MGRGSSHGWLMLAGCLLPILFLFLLPSLGLNDGGSFSFIAILAMFACHFFMMGGHSHGKGPGRHPHGGEEAGKEERRPGSPGAKDEKGDQGHGCH